MKSRPLSLCLATVALVASGCASGGSSSGGSEPSPTAPSPSGTHHMSDEEMAAMGGPSEPAAMICSDEIRTAVQRTLGLSRQPRPERSWSAADLTLTCTYRLRGGPLVLSVHDAPDDTTGRPFFQRLRDRTPRATSIRGVQALGFPALQTAGGKVAFLKDGKTLQVDATGLTTASLPDGLSRQEAAYGVAAAVIACWKE